MFRPLNLPNFNQARVLICGDVMLDRYWHGDTSRISPEAPVPIVRIQDVTTCPGGAANVALNIVAIGAEASLIGVVGRDSEAEDLEAKLLQAGVEPILLRAEQQRTITKLRVMSQNQQLIRLDFEQSGLQDLESESLLLSFEQHLAHAQIVILSDYAKGTLARSADLIALARRRGLAVLVDPKLSDFNHYRGASLVTPNLKEFEIVVGHCASEAQIVERARNLLKSHDLGALLITRGKEGMSLVQADGEVLHIPSLAREVYDVTGAGDTVIGVLAASMAAGSSLVDAVSIANLAAGLVVAKSGTATVSQSELQRAVRHEYSHRGGVLKEAELLSMVADAKACGETVVMTNGCFDILHAGHVQYLQQAKNLGNRLIVAVNSDDSVRRLKGPERPMNSVSDRMQILAALEAVDAVIEFSEDTPARLIQAVLPDVLVKGGDYLPSQIAGAEAVVNNGGEVVILDFKEGCSTTGLIQKIREVDGV